MNKHIAWLILFVALAATYIYYKIVRLTVSMADGTGNVYITVKIGFHIGKSTLTYNDIAKSYASGVRTVVQDLNYNGYRVFVTLNNKVNDTTLEPMQLMKVELVDGMDVVLKSYVLDFSKGTVSANNRALGAFVHGRALVN